MRRTRIGTLLLGFALCSCSTPPPPRNLLDEYRRADFGDKGSWPALDDAYRNRIALEFEIIREGRIEALREAARDPDRYVRAFAVAALGILGDRASEAAIAKLIEDPDVDSMVGGAALQAFGWLKGRVDVVRKARAKTRALGRHLMDLAERQVQDPIDHAAKVREAYARGIAREEIGSAKAGKAAPDFAAVDTEGRSFRLHEVLKEKKVAILVFVSADW